MGHCYRDLVSGSIPAQRVLHLCPKLRQFGVVAPGHSGCLVKDQLPTQQPALLVFDHRAEG